MTAFVITAAAGDVSQLLVVWQGCFQTVCFLSVEIVCNMHQRGTNVSDYFYLRYSTRILVVLMCYVDEPCVDGLGWFGHWHSWSYVLIK